MHVGSLVRRSVWACLALWAGSAAAQEPPPWEGATIRSLQVLGNDVPAPMRLLHELGLRPNTRFATEPLQRARVALLAAGWLRDLRVLPSLVGPDSLVVVVIAQPAPRATLTPLLRMRADNRFVFGGQMQLWGTAGRGERLSLALAGGGEKLLQLEWSEPQPFLALPLGAMLHADLVQETEAADADIVFDRAVVGAKLVIPPRGLRLELGGALWHVRADDPGGLLSGSDSDRLRQGSVAVAWGRRPPSFSWSYLHGSVGVGATTGDAEHQDLVAELRVAQGLGKRCVVAGGAAYRDVRGTVPRYGRLHLGGGPSLRGHAYAVAQGDAGGWGGVEARVPINFWDPQSMARVSLPVAVHVFGDAGSAWGASAPGAMTTAATADQAKLRWSTGIGVTAFLRHAHPLLLELGRDDGGAWRGEFRTSFAF